MSDTSIELKVFESSNGNLPPLTPVQEEILRLKKERKAVLLVHNYQCAEIQRVADFVGDSLGLSYQAEAAKDAEVIVFCGVHFMAETAKIVNPSKKVLLPVMEAGCSLADSCPAEELAAYKAAHPELYVVAYINCSAEVKALADVICTSGNAKKIVDQIPADKEILFVPDQNLGSWVADQTGRKIHLWPGSCYAHVLFSVKEIEKAKKAFPQAPVLVHPECVSSVRALADVVCSTEKMVDFCKTSPADTFIIITETNMLERLRNEIPNKKFVAGPTAVCACNECKFMKMNTPEKLRDCLRDMTPEITMDEGLRSRAYVSLKRMLEWSKN
ncbi:MAG: quinolinate synthase NadA [Opitutales bacterium]|nr:quinolinate synthase NadA [Opitutales bacterium]